MRKKDISLLAAILWMFTTGCWVITVCVDIYFKSTPGWLMLMHGFTALVSLAAAITSYIRYKQQKEYDKENESKNVQLSPPPAHTKFRR